MRLWILKIQLILAEELIFLMQERLLPPTYLFFRAYQTGSENHFSGSTCKPLGIHGLRLREIENTARLLCESLGEQFSCPRISHEDVVEILLKVYPERLAYLENKGTNSYRDSSGLSLQLFKESAVSGSQWVLPLRVLEKRNRGESFWKWMKLLR